MSNILASTDVESRYLEDLLEEKKRLAFYVHGLPICTNLLNQEIARVSEVVSNQDMYSSGGRQLESPNTLSSLNIMSRLAALKLGVTDENSGWNPHQHLGFGQPPIDQGNMIAVGSCSLLTKKLLRLEVPVDTFPDFNFVGRLLGPRGNSLKRIEAATGCRVFIRGRGSMRDRNKEERLRGKTGREHLNEPLHVLIEAEASANEVDAHLNRAQDIILDLLNPLSECQDFYKRCQLEELAMLNSAFKQKNSQPSSSTSRRSGAMKHATNSHKGTK
ncbi:KH domain-containing protein SPIN1-like [Bidens hawaiensis]|uniref:KH domain-containing protein SPIN1-like n=1 Tax=Bidens hawaiensis TaxID=980011 RepID=UPI00404B36B1